MKIENKTTVAPEPKPGELDPRAIPFGKKITPNYFLATYEGGRWTSAAIQPYGRLPINPAAIVFHYGQAVFEGLKAFRPPDRIVVFRPDAGARRFNSSAARMHMPEVPSELFLEAIRQLVLNEHQWVPPLPGCLYLRPCMVGSEDCIGVASAKEFLFFILALPVGDYFPAGGSIRVLVSKSVVRAWPGGTGNIKAAANYAGTLDIIAKAKSKEYRCDQVLFLHDPQQNGKLQELGGMNVFVVRKGELLTPTLGDGTILPGVTRDCVLKLAAELGISAGEVNGETDVDLRIDTVLREIAQGTIAEVIACGTAATVTCVGTLVLEDGREVRVGDGSPGPVTRKLFERLRAIQHGELPDKYRWLYEVSSTSPFR